MCAQCMMAASTAAAGATGIRAWVAARRFRRLTPARLRIITVALIGAALIASSVGLSSA